MITDLVVINHPELERSPALDFMIQTLRVVE